MQLDLLKGKHFEPLNFNKAIYSNNSFCSVTVHRDPGFRFPRRSGRFCGFAGVQYQELANPAADQGEHEEADHEFQPPRRQGDSGHDSGKRKSPTLSFI